MFKLKDIIERKKTILSLMNPCFSGGGGGLPKKISKKYSEKKTVKNSRKNVFILYNCIFFCLIVKGK